VSVGVSIGLVRLVFGLGLRLGLGLVIVFNYENVCTTPRLQVDLLLYSGKIDSFTLAKKHWLRLNLPTTNGAAVCVIQTSKLQPF